MPIQRVGNEKPVIQRSVGTSAHLTPVAGSLTVPATTDTGISTAINTPGSATDTALKAANGPVVTRPKPAASGTAQPLMRFDQFTGDAPFDIVTNEFNNSGSGHGKNGGVWFGWGAALHGDSAGARAAAAQGHMAIFAGFENRYYDSVDDLAEGVEFYIDTAPKNQTAASRVSGVAFDIASRRPFYTRGLFADDDGVTYSFRTRLDIGNSGDPNDSSFTIYPGVASGSPLVTVNAAQVLIDNPVNVLGNLQLSPISADAMATLKGDTGHSASILFQVGTAAKYQLTQDNGSLYLFDNVNGRVQVNYVPGVNANAAYVEFASAVKVQGALVGSGTSAPTAAATGNLGTSPPAPSVVAGSNYVRGTVQIGSGSGTPAAGAAVTLTIPAGVFSSAPKVQLSAKNLATVGRNLYVGTVNATTVQIAFGTAAAASQAVGTYEVDYVLIG